MSDLVYEELAEKVKQFQDGDESAYDDLYRNGQRFVQAEVAKYVSYPGLKHLGFLLLG